MYGCLLVDSLCRSKQDDGRVRIFTCRILGDDGRTNETVYGGDRYCGSSIVTVSSFCKENEIFEINRSRILYPIALSHDRNSSLCLCYTFEVS